MAFKVFDYRRDIKNLIVTPQIRSRFLKMEPGQYNQRHSHDLGYEMFLIAHAAIPTYATLMPRRA